MQPITAQRTFLICLTTLFLMNSPSQASPIIGTNGQNGTPNLPIAPSMIVDKNNMRGSYEQQGQALGGDDDYQRAFMDQRDLTKK